MAAGNTESGNVKADAVPRTWRKLLASVAGVVAIWLCLFMVRRGPPWVQGVLFVVLILLPIALNVTGWLRFRKAARDHSLTGWRKLIVRWGVLANSLALAIPWAVILFAMYSFANHRQPSAYEIDWNKTVIGILILSMYSLIASIMAPGWLRVTLMLNSLIVAGFVLAIPVGVL